MSCLRASDTTDNALLDGSDHNLDNKEGSMGSHPAARLCFTLRRARTASFDLVPPKKNKRVRNAPILRKVFRRSSSKPDSLDGPVEPSSPKPFVTFPLSRDGYLNKTLLAILTQLFVKGPFTQGIFRKSANTRARRELCWKLQIEEGYDVSSVNIILLAAVITDVLRSQSDCLLSSRLYQRWLDITSLSSDTHKRQEIDCLLKHLPSPNVLFLKHFLCVLWHIAQKSSENMMTAANLARCVGPSLLWPPTSTLASTIEEHSKQAGQCIIVATLVEYLILKCPAIFGEECLQLFRDSASREIGRCDSGHEESDSLHSTPSSQGSSGLRRDDSSIDSLDHALLAEGDSSPKLAAKSNASLTNLSRDSGLTMSDTQLYTPDEEGHSECSGDTTKPPPPSRNVNVNQSGSTPSSVQRLQQQQQQQHPNVRAIHSLPANKFNRNGSSTDVVTPKTPLTATSNNTKGNEEVVGVREGGGVGGGMSFPLSAAGREVIKRRVSRVRTWGKPVSAYFMDYSTSTPTTTTENCYDSSFVAKNTTDYSSINNQNVILKMCKSASEESLLNERRPPRSNNYSTMTMSMVSQCESMFSRLRECDSSYNLYGSSTLSNSGNHSNFTSSRSRTLSVADTSHRVREPVVAHSPMVRSKSMYYVKDNDDDDHDNIYGCGGGYNGSGDPRSANVPRKETMLDCRLSRSTPHIDAAQDDDDDEDDNELTNEEEDNSAWDIYGVVSPRRAPLSARTIHMYEESVRVYNEAEIHHAAPARVDSSPQSEESGDEGLNNGANRGDLLPPPLPPKADVRGLLSSSSSSSSSSPSSGVGGNNVATPHHHHQHLTQNRRPPGKCDRDALCAYLSGERNPAPLSNVVQIGGKNVLTNIRDIKSQSTSSSSSSFPSSCYSNSTNNNNNNNNEILKIVAAPRVPVNYYMNRLNTTTSPPAVSIQQQVANNNDSSSSKKSRHHHQGKARLAATMSRASSLVAAVGREIGRAAERTTSVTTSMAHRVRDRPRVISSNSSSSVKYSSDIYGSVNPPPPYRHPPIVSCVTMPTVNINNNTIKASDSKREGPWKTTRCKGVIVHQWQQKRNDSGEESYV